MFYVSCILLAILIVVYAVLRGIIIYKKAVIKKQAEIQ